MPQAKSDLMVVTKTKELCDYVLTVTQKSPKNFRYTFVSRLQEYALNAIENLYRANDIYLVPNDSESAKERLSLQHKALTELRLEVYMAEIACRHECILLKHYEQISRLGTDCMNLVGAWIASDKKRLSPHTGR